MEAKRVRLKLAAVSGLAVLGGLLLAADGRAPDAASAASAIPTNQIATATFGQDLRVSAVLNGAPQLILTTPAADYTGGPVVVTFSVQYVNMIPDPTSTSNGIGFDLYMDGEFVERIGLFGTHVNHNLFAPINLTDVLDGARAPAPGQHTFSLGLWKWQPGGDGYLRGDGGMAMRLSVSRL